MTKLIQKHKPVVVALLETRVLQENASAIVSRLGYTDSFIVDPHGFSAVYGSTNKVCRKRVWDEMNVISGVPNEGWMIMGDLNTIAASQEKRGGRKPTCSQLNELNDVMRNCGLLDLGDNGPRWNWNKKRVGLANIKERLDRVLVTPQFCNRFSMAQVLHLPYYNSDHRVVLIDLDPKKPFTPRPYRLEVVWAEDPRFNDVDAHQKLVDAQLNFDVDPSLDTKDSMTDCLVEYLRLLRSEELFWKQKSRVTWLREGDLNTKYFHIAIMIRRHRNSIVCLKDDRGIWVIIESENNRLIAPVREMEIKKAINQLGTHKAPGPDGLQGFFFRKYWDQVSQNVIGLVNEFFQFGHLDKRLNKTYIALIPKKSNPVSIKEYRPISLCNFVMKIITKILTNRIRPMLDKIISENQHTFLAGRSIFDSTVIYNEIIHSFKSKKGEKGWMAFKMDFDKAYDRISWALIAKLRSCIGFDQRFIQWVMMCVEYAFQVLISGSPSQSFLSSNGIRQGEPMFPFLFILCLEALSRLIKHGIGFGCWSGQRISDTKSTLLTSSNLSRSFTRGMENALRVQVASHPGKYLGIPLQWGRVSENTYVDLTEKIENRLQGSKVRTLNMAGRSTLIRSVLDPVSNHIMSMLKLPKGLFNKVNRFRRNFLWGGDKESRKMHNVGWSKVCFPNVYGGLNLRDLECNNLALLTKIAWRIFENLDSSVSKVLQAKYHKVLIFGLTLAKMVALLVGRHMKVKDVIQNGNWCLDAVDNLILAHIADKIKAIPLSIVHNTRDRPVWEGGKDGKVSVKEAYHYLISNKMCHNKLNVNESLYQKGIGAHLGYNLFDNDTETINHLFFGCNAVWPIWRKIHNWLGFMIQPDLMSPTFIKDLCNLKGQIGGLNWGYILPFLLWNIWLGRNKAIFKNQKFNAFWILKTSIRSAGEYLVVNNVITNPNRNVQEILVPWNPPMTGFHKLNSDGSSDEFKNAGTGGVIRDESGRFAAC
ncbi:uncharacterized protein LOC113312041 [Papaver somniferum]|uniref:uncharacterized protein LOC113312041 n=1 Tax=Papaver somniferum TaxID=3469 RepID=UPI000E703B87|nr:uncharacterized protein LOC113312041 [Papaver somniferum]